MNDLEKAILKCARKAQAEYERITGGWWLMHGPESFLQNFLAIELSKSKFLDTYIYPECSPKRLKVEFDKKCRGAPVKVSQKQRFDIVFWWRNKPNPRALMEIKLGNDVGQVLEDAKKLRAYFKEARRLETRSSYLLFYSQARRNTIANKGKGPETLTTRFANLEKSLASHKTLPFKLVGTFIDEDAEADESGIVYAFGFALYRMDY